jgi:hypothetical protein
LVEVCSFQCTHTVARVTFNKQARRLVHAGNDCCEKHTEYARADPVRFAWPLPVLLCVVPSC